ncbi:MAG: tetratricopeptide repeat protein, partial [Planctomycetaceae bacterium]|nr:tetratricopeptide repeat protein [Planctomycetaceae bacterium]
MFTARRDSPRFWRLVLGAFACLALLGRVPNTFAQEIPVDAELVQQQKIVGRFLEVLEKNPRRGTALDRVYGFHVENGSLDQLVKQFQERTAKNSKDGAAWTILGLIESKRGQDAAAVEAFSNALAAGLDPLPAYYQGQSLVLIGRSDQAVQSFEQALSRKPAPADLLEIFQALGRVHQRAQHTREALEVWNRLEKLFPKDVRVQEQIAVTLAEEGQTALALPRYEKLIQLTKDDYRKSVFRMEAAELKVKLNRSAEAIADYDQLLATLNPTSWLYREVRRKVEAVFLRTDDYNGLAMYYQTSVTRNPEDVDAMARLARILAQQGRVPEAQVWLDKALKLAPTRRELRQTFIEQLVEDHRYSEAVAQYELLDKSEPNNPDLLREWGKLLLRDQKVPLSDRMQAAEKVWRRMLAARPQDPLIAIQVADLFRNSEMHEAALQLYQQAVKLAPEQTQYLEYLGEHYHQLKRVPEALATWRRMTEGKRRTAANLARLADVLASFDYLQEAIPEIQAACQLDPKDLALQVKAANLLTKAGKYPEAVAFLERAEQLAQNSEEAEVVLSTELKVFELEDSLGWRMAKLIKAYQQGQPTAKQWFRLARYHAALQQNNAATQAIDSALKLEPNSIPLLAAAARIYEEAGELQSAADLNRRLAVVDRRGRADYLKNVAQLEAQLGRSNEALLAGRELINVAPGNSDNYEFYANLCFRLGKTEEGLQTLRRAARVDPSDPRIALSLATALTNLRRLDEAIELYWLAFEKSPNLDDKLSQIQKLTELHLETNLLEKLLERLRRMRRDAEDKREATICLAQAYNAAGDLGLARQELESLVTDHSRDTQLLSQLSKLASTEGDLVSAVKYQQQLAKLAPGPETELPLATLLAEVGETQESTAITVRLAAREQDPEKFLSSLDSLISAGQDETVLALTAARLRERPHDWELLYREGVALAKKSSKAAAARFQTILDLPNADHEPGVALQNQIAKSAKFGPGSGPSAVSTAIQSIRPIAQDPQSVNILLSSTINEIRNAVGLSSRQLRARQTSGTWTPADFGQARIAALGWEYRFARDSKQSDEFVAKYHKSAQDPRATPRVLWDSICVTEFDNDDMTILSPLLETTDFIKRLAAAGDPNGEYLYLNKLSRRGMSATHQTDNDAVLTLTPLSKDEISVMLSAFHGLRKRAQSRGSAASGMQFTSVVMSELKRAGELDEEQKLYHSFVDGAQSSDELSQAILFLTQRED